MLALFRKAVAPSPWPAAMAGAPVLDETWLRPRGDAYVRIANHDYALRAWSRTGFLAAPFDGDLVPGQKARATLVVRDFHDKDGGLTLTDEVTVQRIDGHGLMAKWRPLSPRKRALVDEYHRLKSARH